MDRENLEGRARVLGVPFNSRTSDEVLQGRIAEAEAAAVADPANAAPVERVSARVLWPNVWSSEGKHMKGETYKFTREDFDALDAIDAIKKG